MLSARPTCAATNSPQEPPVKANPIRSSTCADLEIVERASQGALCLIMWTDARRLSICIVGKDQDRPAFPHRPLKKGRSRYSFRWPESSTTLRHRPVSVVSMPPEQGASVAPVMGMAPTGSANRCLMRGSPNAALISLFRRSMTVLWRAARRADAVGTSLFQIRKAYLRSAARRAGFPSVPLS